MKKDKHENEYSILNTNSAATPFEEEAEPQSNKKQIWQTVGVFLIVVALVAGLLIVGGIASERMHQKQLLREPDESMTAFYSPTSEPEMVKDTVQSLVTEVYYTNEKGLMVSLCFANALEQDQHLTKIAVTIRDKDKNGNIVAKGNTDKIDKDYVVPAGETNTFVLYMGPKYVSIKDNSLKELYFDVTVDYLPVE